MNRGRGVGRRLVWGVGALLLAACASLTALAVFLFFAQEGSGEARAECALVFGSAVYGFDTPGPAMLRRVSTAVRLYHEGSVKRLIVSGGRTSPADQSEAEVMSRYARRQSVNQRDIVLEDRSRSTWQNLSYARPLAADCASVVAVSDGYHLGRIRLFARLLGWGSLATVPADEAPPPERLRVSLAREFAAALYYLTVVPFLGEPDERATGP